MHRFIHAARGIRIVLLTQRSAQWHAVATVCVVALGFWFEVSLGEWRWLGAAIIWVWSAESMNTGIEFLGDAVTAQHHPLVGQAKDVAAAAVLFAAVGAAAIGASIFLPRLV